MRLSSKSIPNGFLLLEIRMTGDLSIESATVSSESDGSASIRDDLVYVCMQEVV